MRAAALSLACAALTGCGYGLHQTAKTQPRGAVSLQTAVTYITNANISAQQDRLPLKLGAEVGPVRVGLSDHVDVGLGFLYGTGGRLDAKFNVLSRSNRLAIAPRLGAGYAVGADRQTAMWMGGVIASYDVHPRLSPYVSATFANHWFRSQKPSVMLKAGEQIAPPTGTGDGLLQLVVGAQWRASSAIALSAEYGLWLPMQDDPGAFYTFVTSQIASFGLRVCFSGRCE